MLYTVAQVRELLDELDSVPADELEDQQLDFKEWNLRSMSDAVNLTIEMAVCMANGEGGTVVFGVNDKATGRDKAVLGVPPEVDINRLKKAVYDSTDPKITPVFEELRVDEGTGRLLIMQVPHGCLGRSLTGEHNERANGHLPLFVPFIGGNGSTNGAELLSRAPRRIFASLYSPYYTGRCRRYGG